MINKTLSGVKAFIKVLNQTVTKQPNTIFSLRMGLLKIVSIYHNGFTQNSSQLVFTTLKSHKVFVTTHPYGFNCRHIYLQNTVNVPGINICYDNRVCSVNDGKLHFRACICCKKQFKNAEHQNVKKQSGEDSIKLFSIQPSPPIVFSVHVLWKMGFILCFPTFCCLTC